jgi:hypothetical protein
LGHDSEVQGFNFQRLEFAGTEEEEKKDLPVFTGFSLVNYS